MIIVAAEGRLGGHHRYVGHHGERNVTDFNRAIEQSPGPAPWDPEGTTATQVDRARRMMRAHLNAVENLVIFAPLVSMLALAEVSTPLTAGACRVYFFARAAHYLIFTFGIPMLRIPAFAVGVTAQLILACVLLGWL